MRRRVWLALRGIAGMVPFILLLGFANGWDWMMRAAKLVGGFVGVAVTVGMFALGALAIVGAFLGDFDD